MLFNSGLYSDNFWKLENKNEEIYYNLYITILKGYLFSFSSETTEECFSWW